MPQVGTTLSMSDSSGHVVTLLVISHLTWRSGKSSVRFFSGLADGGVWKGWARLHVR